MTENGLLVVGVPYSAILVVDLSSASEPHLLCTVESGAQALERSAGRRSFLAGGQVMGCAGMRARSLRFPVRSVASSSSPGIVSTTAHHRQAWIS